MFKQILKDINELNNNETSKENKEENSNSKDNEEYNVYQIVLQLKMNDYHRFHSPVTQKIKIRNHIIGHLHDNKYDSNERVVLFG